MPVQSFVHGPGTLTLGAGALAVTSQVTRLLVKWSENVSEGETIALLDGTELRDEDQATYRATLEGNFVQDLAAAGVVDWSWTNRGTEQAFVYVPNTVAARDVIGTVVPIPLDLGGDMKKRNRSDFAWRCPTDPILGNVGP